MNWNLILPPVLLAGSNVLMNLAWYGHLKTPAKALWVAVLVSWGIAFFEYWLAVPANRIGARAYNLAQLKTMQEVLSLATFVGMAWVMFGQRPGWSHLLGFALIAAGAALIFKSH
ncbi:hypothetical protein GTZ99_03290 [Novosphingobium sp. FSY-8]|uniref:DMT family protein n=1 Tax=Novosphingobium ovatum TaxID=1908523 RepID=A0ABW9XAM0_9SPHN|nr:DMT family protein [Novosphingobium ovatum]NBC35577.1 hypothetical protein [Novosphingobium ovatum]